MSIRSISSHVEAMIATGKPGSDLIDWTDQRPRDLVEAIKRAHTEFARRGWRWVEDEHEFRKDGWRLWFRPQGTLAPPIVTWSRIA